jgi:hypothetical protein
MKMTAGILNQLAQLKEKEKILPVKWWPLQIEMVAK